MADGGRHELSQIPRPLEGRRPRPPRSRRCQKEAGGAEELLRRTEAYKAEKFTLGLAN
jgi:hypothetical protein